jgi:hypothetical protein
MMHVGFARQQRIDLVAGEPAGKAAAVRHHRHAARRDRRQPLGWRQPHQHLHAVERRRAGDAEAVAVEQRGELEEAEMVDEAERRAVAIAGQVAGAIAQQQVALAEAQMREQAFDVDDALQHAEHNNDVGLDRRLARELAGVEIADHGVGHARDQVAALIAAAVRQRMPQHHGPAVQLEHAGAGGDELGGEGGALVMRWLRRIWPERRRGGVRQSEIAIGVERHCHRAAVTLPDAARAGESTLTTEPSWRVAVNDEDD